MTLENRGLEVVIGLEVHVELNTETKMFCACPTTFGAPPNTLCCPVCAGLPGGIPALNRRAVEKAITAGLALHCEIAPLCRMDRKQYFYPDLPKAYQISQNEYPLCKNGYLDVGVGEETRRIGITRIHMEEDAGKLIHTSDGTLLDCNRCGVGLIEIVSEPDLRSAAEAVAYLKELRDVLLVCGVSDCRLQEGSFRCDVNLSLRPVGSSRMGQRTEIKNLNSFSFAEKAIAAEIRRQLEEWKETGAVLGRTVRFLPDRGYTEPMRLKESAADYRFFPEPRLASLRIPASMTERLRRALPELPADKRRRLAEDYGLSAKDAATLTATVGLSDYYEAAVGVGGASIPVCNLLLNDLLPLCSEDPFSAPVSAVRLGELGTLLMEGKITRGVSKKLLLRLVDGDFSPAEVAEREGLTVIRDRARIRAWVAEVLLEDPHAVLDYRSGKTNAFRALQGRLMGKSGGRADPGLAESLLLEMLTKKEDEGNV